jgi:NAD(P)-dependent dehydrogenase (short-subunit alcohol dehydrogenase family)
MAENGQKPPDHSTPQQAWDSRAPTVPLKVSWLQPEDISPMAVFIASDAAALITGAEFEVDAGDSAKDI